jgi:hypothetical protein
MNGIIMFTVPTANDAPTGNWEQWLAWVVRFTKASKLKPSNPIV